MTTMVSSEIENIVDMNQFDDDYSKQHDINNISLCIKIGSKDILSHVRRVKFKNEKISTRFLCNDRQLDLLLRSDSIDEIKIGSVFNATSLTIETKQFTIIDKGLYQVKLVVLNCNN